MARRTEFSFTAALAALEVGEVASRAVRVDETHTVEGLMAWLPEAKASLSNNVRASMRAAASKEGHEYSLETVDLMTGKAVYVIALVTRTA